MSIAVAIVALLVSVSSLTVAILSYRRGGPRLHLAATHWSPLLDDSGAGSYYNAALLMVNTGAAEITISRIHTEDQAFEARSGPKFPFRMSGYSQEFWRLAIKGPLPVALRIEAAGKTYNVPVQPVGHWEYPSLNP